MPRARRDRKLADLFNKPQHEVVLTHILEFVRDGDIPSVLRLCKHVNNAMTTSPKIQLHLRKMFHGIQSLPKTRKPPAIQITQLVDREKRLDALTPDEIRCLHFPHGDVVDVKDGLMLVAESNEKVYLDENQKHLGYERDAWSVIQLGDDAQSGRRTGGDKVQGFRRWRVNYGQRIDGMAMCPEDNVLLIAVVPMSPNAVNQGQSEQFFIRRIFLYLLRPPSASTDSDVVKGWSAIPHPDAFAPCIDLAIPGHYDIAQPVIMQAVPNGRLAMQQEISSGDAFSEEVQSFLGAWDWKKGLALGCISPSCQTTRVSSFRFLDSITVICSTFRVRDAEKVGDDPHPHVHEEQSGEEHPVCCLDVYELASTGTGIAPDGMLAKTLKGLSHYKPQSVRPCAWNMTEVGDAVPITSFNLPAMKPHNSTSLSLTFAPVDCHLSAECLPADPSCLYSTSVVTFALRGIVVDDPGAGPRCMTLRGAIPVLRLLETVSSVAMYRDISGDGEDEDIENLLNDELDEEDKADVIQKMLFHLGMSGGGTGASGGVQHGSKNEDDGGASSASTGVGSGQTPGWRMQQAGINRDRHYHLHHSPWSEWSEDVPIDIDNSPIDYGHHGSKVVSIEVEKVKAASVDINAGLIVSNCRLVIKDYSLRLAKNGGESFLSKPIGSLQTTHSDTATSSTRVVRCPLTRPIALPTLGDAVARKAFGHGTTRYGKEMFIRSYTAPKRYIESSRMMEMDSSRPLKRVFFDGETVVLAMRSGANILKF